MVEMSSFEQIVDLASGVELTIKQVPTNFYPGDEKNVLAVLVAQTFSPIDFIEGLQAIGLVAIKKASASEVNLEILVREKYKNLGIEEALRTSAMEIVKVLNMRLNTATTDAWT